VPSNACPTHPPPVLLAAGRTSIEGGGRGVARSEVDHRRFDGCSVQSYLKESKKRTNSWYRQMWSDSSEEDRIYTRTGYNRPTYTGLHASLSLSDSLCLCVRLSVSLSLCMWLCLSVCPFVQITAWQLSAQLSSDNSSTKNGDLVRYSSSVVCHLFVIC